MKKPVKAVKEFRLTFKTALLYLYKITALSDGERSHEEFMQMHEGMMVEQGISKEDWDNYVFSYLGESGEEQEKVFEFLKCCTHSQQVTALAWVKRIMQVDDEEHPGELRIYFQLKDFLNILEEEICSRENEFPAID